MSILPLADLPIELLQDHLCPHLPAKDLLSLALTNKFFAALCNAEAVWKRKLVLDFNYSAAETARTGGWKVIYRGLHKPRVYLWGGTGNARLGSQLPQSSVYSGVPFPFQFKFPNPSTRIVSLSSGGMSFAALDSEGSIHVWGTLDGSRGYSNDRESFGAGMPLDVPHKLVLPAPIRSISFGRLHMTALDAEKRVWTFTSWGKPFTIRSPLLQDPLAPPVQVESGWNFSAALTAAGEVYVWWPMQQPLRDIVKKAKEKFYRSATGKGFFNRLQAGVRGWGGSTHGNGDLNEIRCRTCEIEVGGEELKRLPGLPALPVLRKTGDASSDSSSRSEGVSTPPPRIVQLAGLDNHLVALTDRGHVLKIGVLMDEIQREERGEGDGTWGWEYLPQFCDLEKVRKHTVFKKIVVPETMKITHITGNFKTFVAYSTGASSSLVLIGQDNATPSSTVDIKPELQHQSVISVSMGDWHSAALTASGRVLTWGAFSSGALGLGDPAVLRAEARARSGAALDASTAAGENVRLGKGNGHKEAPGNLKSLLTNQLPEAYLDGTGWWAGNTRQRVETPLEVTFDYGSNDPKEPFAFAIAAAGWHTGALVMDLNVRLLPFSTIKLSTEG